MLRTTRQHYAPRETEYRDMLALDGLSHALEPVEQDSDAAVGADGAIRI